ncbi:MAG TPA: hypothetical protein VE913_17485 [Longimicrobium sp.]|nr:hypothetical protein [Longimicrobium sp.]
MTIRSRDGFALLAVLWVLVGVSALALVAQLAARESVAASRNRSDLGVAAWRAEGCAERARAAISAALQAARAEGPGGGAWNGIARVVADSPLTAGCELSVRAVGATLDVNSADAESLHRFFLSMGIAPALADSVTDALLDWRDADGDTRPSGAEAGAYSGRPVPRNGPFAHPRELLRVRGMERVAGIDTLLGVDSARVALNQAPLPVLAALPGFTPELLARIAERRARGEIVTDLIDLWGALSPGGRAGLDPRASTLAVTTQPDGWIVTSRARVGTPPVTAVLELRLVRAGERAAVVRRRGWVE